MKERAIIIPFPNKSGFSSEENEPLRAIIIVIKLIRTTYLHHFLT